MIRLRKILLCNFFYYILLLFVLIFTCFRVHIKRVSQYSLSSTSFTGTILSIKIEGDLLSLTLRDKKWENIFVSFRFSSEEERNMYQDFFLLGDFVLVEGEFTSIKGATTPNVFDYKMYAYRKNIFYSIQATSIVKLKSNKNLLFSLKNFIYHYFSTFKNGKYLSLLLLGEKTYMDRNILSSFQNNGISHLFAVSGMHVGILSSLILSFFKKIGFLEERRYFLTCFLLFFYMLLTGCTASVTRAFLFFFLFTINKIFYFHVEGIYIFILTASITLLCNPYFIYDVGFQYSFLISFTLLLSQRIINRYKNYFMRLFVTSFFSFFVSIPITTYHFYQINLLSIFYNLFYVPFVTVLLFPLSLLILIVRPLAFFYDFFIWILESSSLCLTKIDSFCFIFGKVPFFIYILYFLFFFLFLKFLQKKILFFSILLLMFHYFYFDLFNRDYLVMLDIGQGDSFLIHSRGQSILIDTGGVLDFQTEPWREREKKNITDTITLPYLKSRGIKKIDYLLLTHGDFDHLGEAIHIIENYRIGKIFINDGKINFLEEKIIHLFPSVEICYQNTYFEVGDFKFFSLNTDLGDENSSSIVLYVLYKDYKMLFMGDANFKSEEYLMKNYNLEKIHLLKLGHHGSKSSSNATFLELLSPDLALISAGFDNKFNHPNQETLERLKKLNVEYYVTNEVGTVEIDFSHNHIKY